MKNVVLFFLLVLGISANAQYSNPYRMTFDGSNYFVTNKGNGTVSKLNSTFAHSTVITGLTSPNDIFFGSVAGNSALAVIDTNILKLYSPTAYTGLLNIPITGAVEAHDGVFNPSNTNEFFISDRAGNKIIKGSIGSAPFYPITFSTLASNISKPAGMIFNSQGKLLVVTDTVNAEVWEINTTTGAKSLKLSTSKDNFNDIAQDGQGNYYITCWGDDNLYRYSSTFTNAYVVATFNNPSGLLSNLTYDYLGICCHNCQKVEFKFFHLFSPLTDVTTCVNDSFYADFTPTYQGIGTYVSGNKFVVQMSDSSGSFASPIELGSTTTITPPNTIKAAVPSGTYALAGYKYRLASTSPMVISYFEKDLIITPQPFSSIYDGDTASTCIGVNLPLEINHEANTEYSWFPPTGIVSNSIGKFEFTNTATTGHFSYLFQVKDTISGCLGFDHFVISVQPKLELIGLKDSLALCIGDTISIGVSAKPYIFKWTGSNDLNADSIANPQFYGTTSTQINVSFSDSSLTCSGTDSVYVTVNPLPPFDITQDVKTYCFGDTITFTNSTLDEFAFTYATSNPLTPIAENANLLQYLADSAGTYFYQLTISNTETGCYKDLENAYQVFGAVPKPEIIEGLGWLYLAKDYGGTYKWMYFDQLLNKDTFLITDTNAIDMEPFHWSNFISVEVTDSNGCTAVSDDYPLVRESVEELSSRISIHPNPSKGNFAIQADVKICAITVRNTIGQVVFTNHAIDQTHYNVQSQECNPGIYIVEVLTDKGMGVKKIVLE